MIYNSRYLFSKYSDIKKEYDFASPIYCIDASIEHGLIFLGQEDKVSKYTVSTKTPATITATRCTRLAYNESSNAGYKVLEMILTTGSPNLYYYAPATNTFNTGIVTVSKPRCLGVKRGVNDSLWIASNPDDASYLNFRCIISSPNSGTFWPAIYASVISVACISNVDMYVLGKALYYSPQYVFRKAEGFAQTDLASPYYPIDYMIASIDNTKIYGIYGNWWSGFDGGTTLRIYNIAGNSWSAVSLPANFLGYSLVNYNGSLFVTGYDTAKAKGCIAKFDGTSSFELFYSLYNEKLYTGVDYNGVLYLGGSTGKLSTYTE